jgi:hypothetical protein
MLFYAIAAGVVITLVIIRQLPRGSRGALDTKVIRKTETSKTNTKASSQMRGTSLAIHEALSKDDVDSGEEDSLDLDEWRGRRESVRCACDSIVMIGLFAAIVYVLIQDYRYDLAGYLKKALPRETALVSSIVSGVKKMFEDIHERFFQDEL